MSDTEIGLHLHESDLAPGDEPADGREIAEGIRGYLIGLGLATLITVVAFFVSRTSLVWQPSIPIALMVLAIAQMGVHLVFFLHITTGARELQQRVGAGVRRADRVSADCRITVDHDSSQSQHDVDGADDSDAALDCWSAVLIPVQSARSRAEGVIFMRGARTELGGTHA